MPDTEAYPWCLPVLRDEFELAFDRSITIIVGEPESALSPARQIEFLEPVWTGAASAR
ncbi:hypothetical protein [Bosea sp. LjRoot237]|uniref:hypothetical protein n=1 Tax=Bosea sp. LjRoot237 TaxID=3342292 RepID=UPI003F4F68A0